MVLRLVFAMDVNSQFKMKQSTQTFLLLFCSMFSKLVLMAWEIHTQAIHAEIDNVDISIQRICVTCLHDGVSIKPLDVIRFSPKTKLCQSLHVIIIGVL